MQTELFASKSDKKRTIIDKRYHLGKTSEYLCCYLLQKWGWNVARVADDLPFDLIANFKDDTKSETIRIQVKSRSTININDNKYTFMIAGYNATSYHVEDFDYVALVALDIEKVLFIPHFELANINEKCFRLSPVQFTDEFQMLTPNRHLAYNMKRILKILNKSVLNNA